MIFPDEISRFYDDRGVCIVYGVGLFMTCFWFVGNVCLPANQSVFDLESVHQVSTNIVPQGSI